MLKLNPSIVMRPSCLVTSFSFPPPPLRSSPVVFSPPIVLKRGIRSSFALFKPLRVASPKSARSSVKITPTTALQLKELSDALSSDDEDDDEVEDQESDDEDSDDEYDDGRLDVVRKFMKYVDQLMEQKRDVKSPRKVEDSDDAEASVDVVREYMKYMKKLMQKRDSERSQSGNYIKEDDDGMYLRAEMPGLSKEDVKVTLEKNMLVVKGKERKEASDDEKGMIYNGKVKLETELYKIDKIKAEMKNGVLMVVVPKLKEEERKDIIQVKVE